MLSFGLEVLNRFFFESWRLPIDVAELMERTLKAPFGLDGFWVTFMLLSTLIPTALHFGIVLSSFFTLHFTTHAYRERLIRTLRGNVLARLDGPCLHFAFYFTNSIAVVLLLGYLVVKGVGMIATPVSLMLYQFGEWSIQLARF